MKRILIYFIIIISIFFINEEIVYCEIDIGEYNTYNLSEMSKFYDMEIDYMEDENQVPIYLFYGNGCSYCENFIYYLNEIYDEYGKYFKLVAFEVWNDENNFDLLNKIGSFNNKNIYGVPFIIIGKESFDGFNEDFRESIKNAIIYEYNSYDRYDIMEKYNEKQNIIELDNNDYSNKIDSKSLFELIIDKIISFFDKLFNVFGF